MKLSVVDIYSGDVVRDFAVAKANGLLGVIHKATQGVTYSDKTYGARRKAATNAGLLWGAYHFASNAPVHDQVSRFLSVADPDSGTLLALDFEALPGKTMSVQQARDFIGEVETRAGRTVVLYSGNLIKEGLGSKPDAFFGQRRLWLAQYSTRAQVQASWRAPWLWQYSDGTAGPGPHSMAGLPGDAQHNLDCNFYPGDPAGLAGEWSGHVVPILSSATFEESPSPPPLATVPRPVSIAQLEEELNSPLPPEEA